MSPERHSEDFTEQPPATALVELLGYLKTDQWQVAGDRVTVVRGGSRQPEITVQVQYSQPEQRGIIRHVATWYEINPYGYPESIREVELWHLTEEELQRLQAEMKRLEDLSDDADRAHVTWRRYQPAAEQQQTLAMVREWLDSANHD